MNRNGAHKSKFEYLIRILKDYPVLAGIGVILIIGCCYLLVDSFVVQSDELVIESSTSDDAEAEVEEIYVHVAGCVANPGLYTLPDGSRIFDAIEIAGGFTDSANQSALNLARVLVDGEQIIVPDNTVQSTTASEYSSQGKININSASQSDLETLSGVGEATAKRIIQYRTDNGYFKTIEDIMNVSGIGEKKFEAIKNDICV